MRPPIVLEPETFARFGFFVLPGFLTPGACRRLRRRLKTAPSRPGEVHARGRTVRAEGRRVDVLSVPAATRVEIDVRLDRLRPTLEEHFGCRLAAHEPVQFLRYRRGGHYGLHTDRTPGTRDPDLRRRKVSVVVFLNGPGRGPGRCLGGELVFPARRSRGARGRLPLAVDPEPGLLIAFRPDLEHEVRPVTHGSRFSLATWIV